MASPSKIMVKVSSRTIKKQGKVSFWLDNHMEAIVEVSGGTIKWEYFSKVKHRYQA